MKFLFSEKISTGSPSPSHGFTLIEVIASLVLLGILVSAAGFGLVRVVEGYAFSRENQEMTQKAQLALGRMTREIVELLRIQTATASSVVLENREGVRSFGLHNGAIRLALGSGEYENGDLLVEGVSAFTLTWHSGSGSWTDTAAIETLSMVDMQLTLIRSDGMTLVFSGRAAPRNNKNIGGASPAMPPPTAPSYGLCMVAALDSAAEGMEGVKRLLGSLFLLAGVFAVSGLLIRRRCRKFREKGSILIGLVVTMVVISVLTAALLPMFTASTMNQVFSDQGRKAFFLAESGFRYAASRFLNAGNESARLASLGDMNGKTYTLAASRGAFSLVFEPYWFKTQGTLSGATTVSVSVYGNVPPEFTRNSLPAGRILVGSTLHAYTGGSGGEGNLSFTGVSPSLTVVAGTDVRVASRISAAQTLSRNGSLTLNASDAWAFPELNGNFTLKSSGAAGITGATVFNYERRVGNTLQRVTLSDPVTNAAWTGNLSISGVADVVLEPYLRVRSTGIAGGAQRTVAYNVPVGWIAGGDEFRREVFLDRFDESLGAWFAGNNQMLGSHGLSDEALKVNRVDDPTDTGIQLVDWLKGLLGWGSGRWAAIAFNPNTVNTNLAQSWHDAGGNLSYDIQVKVKNDKPYFMQGLGFRMRNNDGTNNNNRDLYTYGVSLVRYRDGRFFVWFENDDINLNLRPSTSMNWVETGGLGPSRYSDPFIILWQRTGPSTGRGNFKVLAYRRIRPEDGITEDTGVDLRLKPWVTLMVRLIEGYELPFSNGTQDSDGNPLKAGSVIRDMNGKTARIMGTPVVASGTWEGGNAAGVMMLANVPDTGFASGTIRLQDQSHVYAQAGTQGSQKVNHIMVFCSDDKAADPGNLIQTDSQRIGNPRNSANWPPDDRTDLKAGLPTATPPGNDYYTLIQWIELGAGLGTEMAPSLTSPNWSLGAAWEYDSSRLRKRRDGSNDAERRAQPTSALSILPGETYQISLTVSDWGGSGSGRNFTYSLGGMTVRTVTGNGTYTDEITASSSGNLIITASQNSRFRITTVSVRQRIGAATLDTTPDGQGKVASYVPARTDSDFYRAIIRTDALTSPVWNTSSGLENFASPGDHISLITSSSAGTSTFYDDFAIQLDQKAGTGFLPPIQQ